MNNGKKTYEDLELERDYYRDLLRKVNRHAKENTDITENPDRTLGRIEYMTGDEGVIAGYELYKKNYRTVGQLLGGRFNV